MAARAGIKNPDDLFRILAKLGIFDDKMPKNKLELDVEALKGKSYKQNGLCYLVAFQSNPKSTGNLGKFHVDQRLFEPQLLIRCKIESRLRYDSFVLH